MPSLTNAGGDVRHIESDPIPISLIIVYVYFFGGWFAAAFSSACKLDFGTRAYESALSPLWFPAATEPVAVDVDALGIFWMYGSAYCL